MEIKTFPEDMSVFEVNPANLRECLVSGLFKETVTVNGKERSFYTYLAPGLTYNQSCLVVAPPDDVPVEEYLENSFWLEFARKEKIFIHFLNPEGKWNLDGSDADYMNKVYVQVQSRKYYVTMQDNIYAAGIGAGAQIAQQAAMKMTSEWSGLVTFGDLGEEALLNAEATQKSENMGKVELSISAAKTQLPVWMFWPANEGSNQRVCDYWKKQNDSAAERFSSQDADEIYFPVAVRKTSEINEEKIAQVRVTNGFSGQATEEIFGPVWKFLTMARRHRCHGMKALRGYKDPAACGATLHALEVQGFTRLWYEYVPEQVKAAGKPVPLVVNLHGRGGSAESFMDMSSMNCVAEERGFIVLFPEAGIHQQRPGGLRNILLWNGFYKEEKIDDVDFILKMIEDVKQRYAIDENRIYACGQSSGGMMTSELALRAPQVFAAAAPWSAIKDPDHDVPLPTEISPEVPYFFLFGENDWLCVDREKGQLEYHVSPDIAAFLENLMELYKLDKNSKIYTCGEITYYVYLNEKKVPMLTVGTVKEMSHANYPWESFITYDQFFARFSKKDGKLLYMGEDAV